MNRNSKILDFGCGDGREMESMRKIGFANIIGFDVARWSPNAPEGENIIIDPDAISFLERSPNAFDVIFSRESVYYTPVDEQDRLWRAFFSSLRPGGKLVVIAFNGALSTSSWILQKDLALKFAFTEITLKSFPMTAGFIDVHVEELKSEHNSFVGATLFWVVLGFGKLNSRLRYFTERGLDKQNPRLYSKQIIMMARKP